MTEFFKPFRKVLKIAGVISGVVAVVAACVFVPPVGVAVVAGFASVGVSVSAVAVTASAGAVALGSGVIAAVALGHALGFEAGKTDGRNDRNEELEKAKALMNDANEAHNADVELVSVEVSEAQRLRDEYQLLQRNYRVVEERLAALELRVEAQGNQFELRDREQSERFRRIGNRQVSQSGMFANNQAANQARRRRAGEPNNDEQATINKK